MRSKAEVACGSRLCENSDAELARRISISISSLRKLIALVDAADGRQLRKRPRLRRVFTQPGSKTEVAVLPHYFCSTPKKRPSAGSFDAATLDDATCRTFHAARASASASTLHQSKMYMRLAAARDVQSLLHRLVRNHPANIGLRNSELLSNFRWCDTCLEGSAHSVLFADCQSYGRQFRPLTFSLRR
jgi:hypothetical protein